MQNCQRCINCLGPTVWHQKHCILTRRRNQPYELPYYHYVRSRCSFVPLQLYLMYGFILYYFELIYNECPYNVFSCIYIYVLLCVLNKDQSINSQWNVADWISSLKYSLVIFLHFTLQLGLLPKRLYRSVGVSISFFVICLSGRVYFSVLFHFRDICIFSFLRNLSESSVLLRKSVEIHHILRYPSKRYSSNIMFPGSRITHLIVKTKNR